jgi:hypothetical protein
VANFVAALTDEAQIPDRLAAKAGASESTESVFLILEHLASNGRAPDDAAGRPVPPGTAEERPMNATVQMDLDALCVNTIRTLLNSAKLSCFWRFLDPRDVKNTQTSRSITPRYRRRSGSLHARA